MKLFLSIISITLLVFGCKESKNHTVTCQIQGLQNDTAMIAFIPLSHEEDQIIDTVVFQSNQLTYDLPINELYEAFIIPFDLIYKFQNGRSYPLPASRIRFFIDSLEQVTVTGKIEDQSVNYDVIGNTLSEELSIARQMKLHLFKERIAIEHNFNSFDTTKNSESDYWQLRNENNEKYTAQSIAYIKENPKSHYSARLLLEIRDKQLATELYSQLHKEATNTYFGTILTDMVDGWMLTTPGLEFPNIIDQTLDGKEFELTNLRGKYVLLDFWGSWCKPCLTEVPQLKQLVDRYNAKLEVIGIACNDDQDRLNETIASYNINWKQILEGTKREYNYSNRFGVRSFPTKWLLNPRGQIVKVYSGVDESVYDDIENLLNSETIDH